MLRAWRIVKSKHVASAFDGEGARIIGGRWNSPGTAITGFGLPRGIRTDNGVPFASAHALDGLSKLSVWWLRLGIESERITPGHRQQNGRHERMQPRAVGARAPPSCRSRHAVSDQPT